MVKTSRALPPGIAVVRAPLPTGDWVIVWADGLSEREAAAARLVAVTLSGPVLMTFAQLFALMAAAN